MMTTRAIYEFTLSSSKVDIIRLASAAVDVFQKPWLNLRL
jgi:hypothetical protein